MNQKLLSNTKLAKEWNYNKNKNINIHNVTTNCNEKVWWICEKGHEWKAIIRYRAKENGTNCPYCSGNKVLPGFNDLQSCFPDIASEWHPIKNGNIKPTTISSMSGKKVWWCCKLNHEWSTSVANRTKNKSRCPYCSGKKAIVGINDLATINPKLAKEWNPTKNDHLKPSDVTVGSERKVWWVCNKKHEWQANIKDRQKGNGCPYCSGRLAIIGKNDLATTNPVLASEWHPIKNNQLKPTNVTIGSDKKVWWLCEKGHEWQAKVNQRKKAGCPYCGNKKVLKGFNDLATTHPEIAKQWHPTKNKNLYPYMFSYGSTQKIWWKCSKGHEWYATPNERTNKEEHTLLNCPICSSELKTSFAEQSILYYLKLYTEAHNRKKVYEKEIDIWLPGVNIGIEHDGMYYHQNKEKDQNKIEFFLQKGIKIITVRESKSNNVEDNVLEYDYRSLKSLNKVIEELLKMLGFEIKSKIDVEYDTINIQNQYIQMEKQNSLTKQRPEIAKEWHPLKNGNLTPQQYSCGSHKKVWWLGKCGHEWQQVIKNRALAGAGCPICSGREVLAGFNDLKTLKPEIIKLWHPTKNKELTPSQVTPYSGKKVWWLCEKGHEWETAISGVSSGSRCPYCANQKVWPGYNDLSTTHPTLAKEWHPYLNKGLTPYDVTYGSTKIIWWICSEGHEWEESLNARTNGSGKCPLCQKKINNY